MFPTDSMHHVKELKDKIDSVRFAMFTCTDKYGHLIATPMTNQEMGPAGELWFFTSINTDLWENIAHQPEVNASFAEPKDGLYVSVSGTAERVVDPVKVHELWNPFVEAWLPSGPDDPHVALIRVVPHSAEYWDTAANKMVSLFAVARAALTGEPPKVDPVEHGKIDL
ncbi:pyridoxamine 5'-phosphate oxidase family protein [Massilia cavernae]|uniref:General stress protein FMN-binding split barrel domain-containing protein n=1 Tax=Massilia cavernae TaxID=2320864 RepID=A0A418Y8D6_9BURK|nr:pyridoxamine 5'-phosphate oxidase family protein [Massilia cavernae]RJG27615.1 hypothetical protein D3872_00510 [Massilia cavernae]